MINSLLQSLTLSQRVTWHGKSLAFGEKDLIIDLGLPPLLIEAELGTNPS